MRGLEKIYGDRQTYMHPDRHINTMNRPGLRAGPIEKSEVCKKSSSWQDFNFQRIEHFNKKEKTSQHLAVLRFCSLLSSYFSAEGKAIHNKTAWKVTNNTFHRWLLTQTNVIGDTPDCGFLLVNPFVSNTFLWWVKLILAFSLLDQYKFTKYHHSQK